MPEEGEQASREDACESRFEGWTRVDPLQAGDNRGSNVVSTTKYTRLSFFPRSFLLQYRRVGNIYFTFIVFIMLLGTYTNLFNSPQKPWGNLFILIIIFGLNMLNEGLDDSARRRKDAATNSEETYVLSPDSLAFEATTWGAVRRGDLVRVLKDQIVPADVLLISTSDTDAEPVCYVQTANVDGETYLKKRYCNPEVLLKCTDVVKTFNWLTSRTVYCEAPTPALSSFRTVMLRCAEKADQGGNGDAQGAEEGELWFSSDHIVLRGSQLRNTTWIWALVLHTGKDTKTLMSQGSTQIKQSKVDKMANQVIVTVLIMLVILLIVSVCLVNFAYEPSSSLWYMMYTSESTGYILPSSLALLLTYLILYRQILPILLYAVQEGMNVIQAKFISWDLNMFDAASNQFASCNTTQLAQEIGQVKWVFSDKTGTLTRNEMRLVACSVDGRIYGRATNKALEDLASLDLPPVASTRQCFSDVLAVLAEQQHGLPVSRRKARLAKFFKALSLCHTVLVESDAAQREKKDMTRKLRRSRLSSRAADLPSGSSQDLAGTMGPSKSETEGSDATVDHDENIPAYNAESPDEEALVLGATALGFQFNFTQGESMVGIQLKQVVAQFARQGREHGPISENSAAEEWALDQDEAEGAFATPGEVELSPLSEPQTMPVNSKEAKNAAPAPDDVGAALLRDSTASAPSPALFRSAAPPAGFRIVDSEPPALEMWQVLAVNPFTSDRKRMSVVYREPGSAGRIVLFCKGADNQMLAVADPDSAQIEGLRADLNFFAESGLRTLVVAERVLDPTEFEEWAKLHAQACSLTGRERKLRLDVVACEIERNLQILGVSAVEDRLQDGVPQTISLLRAARINIWLITGDKVETAINISRSAELLTSKSKLVQLTASELGLADGPDSSGGNAAAAAMPAVPSASALADPAPAGDRWLGLDPPRETFRTKATGFSSAPELAVRATASERALSSPPADDVPGQPDAASDGVTASPPSEAGAATTSSTALQVRLRTLIEAKIVEYDVSGKLCEAEEDKERKGFCSSLIQFASMCKRRLRHEQVVADPNLALVVDGEVLHHIIAKEKDEALEAAFLKLGRMCSVVIACRASPGQKAQLVQLVRDNVAPEPITLAIGDGANDVPMIEVGHVGVGISGKEGTHAVNAADFNIAQFKFLAPLLLVHGRLGYIRIAKAISIVFYGNLLFTFVSFYYNFVCGFSGTPAFTNLQYVIFQAFIAIPVFVIGGLDRDFYHVYDVLKEPRSYDVGRLNRILHPAFVDAQILRGLAHGALAFLLVFWNDYDASFDVLSGSLFVVITVVLTVRQARVAASFTWWLVGALVLNVVGVVLVVFAAVALSTGVSVFSEELGRYYWNQLISTVFLVSLLDYLAPIAFNQFRRASSQVKAHFVADEDLTKNVSKVFDPLGRARHASRRFLGRRRGSAPMTRFASAPATTDTSAAGGAGYEAV